MPADAGVSLLGAIIAIGVAVVGWSKANTANRTARDATAAAKRSADAAERSAAEAGRANELGREANDRADRAEVRSTTRNDVQWVSHMDGTKWCITNRGADDAFDVVVILRAGEEAAYSRCEIGEVASLDTAEVIDTNSLRSEKYAANQAVMDRMARGGIFYMPTSSIPLRQRILWTDAAGQSHTTAEEEHDVG